MEIKKTQDIKEFKELCENYPYITEPTENSEEKEFYFLIDSEGNRVAFGYIRTLLSKVGVIGSVFVKEEKRGKSFGSELVKELEDKLSEKGVWFCVLGVHNDNQKGLSFWKRNGYHVLIESVNEFLVKNPVDLGILEKISPVSVPENEVTILGKWLIDADIDED